MTQRIPSLEHVQDEKTKQLFEKAKSKFGSIPNILKTMANSPAVLDTYLKMHDALDEGLLSASLREKIALTVSQSNECNYCLSVHTAIGKTLGLSEDEILDNRQAKSSNEKEQAALQFAKRVLESKGFVEDSELEELRKAGYTNGEITEIVANVILSIFTNYFNHVAETIIDFPKAKDLAK